MAGTLKSSIRHNSFTAPRIAAMTVRRWRFHDDRVAFEQDLRPEHDDKPTVTLTTPSDPSRASAFLNIRVADIAAAYAEWSARGAEFLTEPKDHGQEIRAYIRDPDGHLIEVGQTTGRLR